MIGEVLVATLDRRERHLLDRVVPVRRPGRVGVQVALEVAQLDELRQRALARRLQLAGVLAELGWDELVAEERVELLLVAVRDRLAGVDDGDAVLGDRETAPLRLLPHGDVVLLRAGEVLEQVAVALGRNDAQVEAKAVVRRPRSPSCRRGPTTSTTHGSSAKCVDQRIGHRGPSR